MKVPMRWLNDFVETGLKPKDLAFRLTMAGLEAEKWEQIGESWANCYVGHVVKVERHPDADRLVLATVDAAPHKLTVVTGAPNIKQGQKVALALAGARLIDGHSDSGEYKVLKPGMIRGIKSEGMVCSEKELGISDEHEGIMVLEDSAPAGKPLVEWLGDMVIEFEITPNLAHAFSVLGIAREASALTGAPLTQPSGVDLGSQQVGADSLVTIEAPDLCPRYMGIVLEGITVGPSPEWLQRRLQHAGLRPINNVVDVTNYVMLEYGQPLHAFDHAKLAEGRIVVRRARSGERIETLDHTVRELGEDMLVIADAENPVAIAGVMGGFESEVSDASTTILLEGANFEMQSIRKTRTAVKMRTDASARFERGIDPEAVGPAMARAARLLLEVCPDARITAVRDAYPQPAPVRTISFPFARIERLLGLAFSEEQVLDALNRLDYEVEIMDGTVNVTVPSYRRDVKIREDVIEDVARMMGYDLLPATLPGGRVAPVKRDPLYVLQERVRQVLTSAGASETITYITCGDDQLQRLEMGGEQPGFLYPFTQGQLLRVKNAMQSERNILRPTLLPGLIESAVENLKHTKSVRLFELARAYQGRADTELPNERTTAGIILAGERDPLGLYANEGKIDFFDMKGTIDELLSRLGSGERWTEPASHPSLHPGRQAQVRTANGVIALFGELRPDLAEAAGFEGVRVCVAEVDLDLALTLIPVRAADISVQRFLPAEQDFAIVVDEGAAAGDVEQALRSGAGPLVSGVALFDVYRGQQIGEGKKSLAFRVIFTAPNRTLTDAELVKVREKIEKTLKQKVQGTLRA